MNNVQFACGIPYCSSVEGEETGLSKGSRAALIVIGILAIALGVLALYSVSVFPQMGTTLAWTSIGVGVSLVLTGIAIKSVKVDDDECVLDDEDDIDTKKEHSEGLDHSINAEEVRQHKKLQIVTNRKTIASIKDNNGKELVPRWLVENLPREFDSSQSEAYSTLEMDSSKSAQFYMNEEGGMGIVLKLKIEHEIIDKSYSRKDEDFPINSNSQNSDKPFIIYVSVIASSIEEGTWGFKSLDGVNHREAFCPMSSILDRGFSIFKLGAGEENPQFIKIEKQDDIKRTQDYAPWFLQRILHGKAVEVREEKADKDKKKGSSGVTEAVGYWKISLATL